MLLSCIFTGNKSSCVLCSLSSAFYFVGDKIVASRFLNESKSSIRENYRLKFSQDAALNHVREKGKPRCKISYELLKYEDGCDPLLDISSYTRLIQLKDYLGGIHHCATVVVKWVFDSNFPFALPLTKDNFDYRCNNDNEKK